MLEVVSQLYNEMLSEAARCLRTLSEHYGVVKVDAMAIIQLIQKNRHIKLAGNDKLRIKRELPLPQDRAQMVRDVLKGLGTP